MCLDCSLHQLRSYELAHQTPFHSNRGRARGRARGLIRGGRGRGRGLSPSYDISLYRDRVSPYYTHVSSESDCHTEPMSPDPPLPAKQAYEECAHLLDAEVSSYFHRFNRRHASAAMGQSLLGPVEAAGPFLVPVPLFSSTTFL